VAAGDVNQSWVNMRSAKTRVTIFTTKTQPFFAKLRPGEQSGLTGTNINLEQKSIQIRKLSRLNGSPSRDKTTIEADSFLPEGQLISTTARSAAASHMNNHI
jgi:hypothetical protein